MLLTHEFSERFKKKSLIFTFYEKCPVEAELLRADRKADRPIYEWMERQMVEQTDKTKLIVTLWKFVNVPKNSY